MRICLISPRFPPSLWDLGHCQDLVGTSFPFPPLPLATLAALTPPGHEVRILDENLGPMDLDLKVDLVGITGYHVQKDRVFELAESFRARGIRVALGGPLVSRETLAECKLHADAVFLGEAEYTWPRYIDELCAGTQKSEYIQETHINMEDSPLPRFELLQQGAYSTSIIESSRGCPQACEFCEIPVRLGRRPRTKSEDQVIEEVRALYALGADSVFIVDDNFLGNRSRALSIARALEVFGKETGYRVSFSCQFTIDTARDAEMLEALRRANFNRVFIGIETPRKETLQSAGKTQNTKVELAEAVRTVQSYGIMVWGSFILGFDGDTREVFTEQLNLIEAASIPIAMVGLLQALPGTPLYGRVKREGRLKNEAEAGGIRAAADTMRTTNIVPLNMSEVELVEGYAWLVRRLYDYEGFGHRLLGAINLGGNIPSRKKAARAGWREYGMLWRTAAYYLMSTELPRIRLFLRVVLTTARKWPQRMDVAIMHLIVFKHMRQFYYDALGPNS